MVQLDLFAPTVEPWRTDSDAERLGWERRALADLETGPATCAFPGFMGAVHERLVAKGLAVRIATGVLEKPAFIPPKLNSWWRANYANYPTFTYALAQKVDA